MDSNGSFFSDGFFYVSTGLLIILSILLIRMVINLKKKTRELQYSYDIRKTFIDADNSLIYLKDENLRYVFVNKAVEEFYHRPAKDIIGSDDYALSEPAFSDIRRKTDLAVISERRIIVDEVTWANRIFESRKFPVHLPNGKIGVGAYIRDVTEAALNKKVLEKISLRNQIHINILSHTFESFEIQLKYVLDEIIRLTDSVSGSIYIYESGTFNQKVSINNYSISEETLNKIKLEDKPIINNQEGLILPIYDNNQLVIVVGLKKKEGVYDFIDIYQATLIMVIVWNAKIKRDTELKVERANQKVKENEEKLKLLLDSTYEGIYGIDINGVCTFCNASCLKILGYDDENELIGKHIHDLIHYKDKEGNIIPLEDCKILLTLKHGQGIHSDDEVYWRKDGSSIEVEYFSYPQYKNGELVGAVITFMDITSRKQVEKDILYLSYHDSLTGLYNRRYLEEQLVNLDKPENLPLSVIMADVNGLKITNDIFGHAIGDLLLNKASETIIKNCRTTDIIARWGGDEFIAILPRTTHDEALPIIQNIKKQFADERIEVLRGSISLGVDTKYRDEDIYQVINNAEKRMYEDKIYDRKNIMSNTIDAIMEALNNNHPEELVHSENVRDLSLKIAKALNLSESTTRRLSEAAYYHDIGKIIYDKRLLDYNKKLNDTEYEEIKEHPLISYRILNSAEETMEIAKYALNHHERWDGLGYPKGLKGHDIPQISRIISIAESYDTMVNRKKMSKEEALKEIEKGAGSQFDPELTRVFLQVMRRNHC